MSGIYSAAGATLYIGNSAPTTYNSTTYAAISYTAVGFVESIGEFSRVYQLITFNPVAERGTYKLKGSYNDGTVALQIGRDFTDAGQVAMLAARDSDNSYAIKIVDQKGNTFYFSALIMSMTTMIGTVNDVVKANVTLELQSASNVIVLA